jgi:hypothetical protein
MDRSITITLEGQPIGRGRTRSAVRSGLNGVAFTDDTLVIPLLAEITATPMETAMKSTEDMLSVLPAA